MLHQYLHWPFFCYVSPLLYCHQSFSPWPPCAHLCCSSSPCFFSPMAMLLVKKQPKPSSCKVTGRQNGQVTSNRERGLLRLAAFLFAPRVLLLSDGDILTMAANRPLLSLLRLPWEAHCLPGPSKEQLAWWLGQQPSGPGPRPSYEKMAEGMAQLCSRGGQAALRTSSGFGAALRRR